MRLSLIHQEFVERSQRIRLQKFLFTHAMPNQISCVRCIGGILLKLAHKNKSLQPQEKNTPLKEGA